MKGLILAVFLFSALAQAQEVQEGRVISFEKGGFQRTTQSVFSIREDGTASFVGYYGKMRGEYRAKSKKSFDQLMKVLEKENFQQLKSKFKSGIIDASQSVISLVTSESMKSVSYSGRPFPLGRIQDKIEEVIKVLEWEKIKDH